MILNRKNLLKKKFQKLLNKKGDFTALNKLIKKVN